MSPKAQPHLLSSSRSPVSPMSPTQKEVEILGYKGAYAKLLNAANKVINSNRNAAAERYRSVVHSKQLQKRPSANAAPSRPSQRNKSLPHQPSVEPNQITTQTCNQPTALQQEYQNQQQARLEHFLTVAKKVRAYRDVAKITQLLDEAKQAPLTMQRMNSLNQLEIMLSQYNHNLKMLLRQESSSQRRLMLGSRGSLGTSSQRSRPVGKENAWEKSRAVASKKNLSATNVFSAV